MPTRRRPQRRTRLRDPQTLPSAPRHAALLVIGSILLLALALVSAVGIQVHAPSAYAAPMDTGTPDTATPTTAPTNTPTVTATPATPPSIALVSPTSGKGPVGAHLTISGSNFTAGAAVAVFAASQGDCSQPAAGVTSATANGSGSFTTTFLWPISLNGGAFFICASGITSGAPSYQVLSATAPSLSLSAPSIAVGQTLTINGAGFVGLPNNGQVLLSEKDSSGHTVNFPPAVVGSDGSFTATWTVNSATGAITISADSQQESGAEPVLQATAQVTVTAAGSPTASASVSPTVGGGTSTGVSHSNSGSGLVVLIVIILLVLLVALGVVAFLLLRGRNGPPPDALYGGGNYGPGEYPGFAARSRETQKVPQIGSTGRQPAAGPYSDVDQFGATGRNSAPRIGGVAQWDEPDPLPGPDWQPRPMSGRVRENDASGYGANSSGGMTNPDSNATRADGYPLLEYPPLDPWASQGGSVPPSRQSPPPQRPIRGSGPGASPIRGQPQDSDNDWWGNTNPSNDRQ